MATKVICITLTFMLVSVCVMGQRTTFTSPTNPPRLGDVFPNSQSCCGDNVI
jgi:hypothetical protein